VIGLGQFGKHLVRNLAKLGAEVMAIDLEMAHLDAVKDLAARTICLDAVNQEALAGTEISQVDTAVVSIGQDLANSVLIVTLLKKLGVPHIIARASSILHYQILEAVGAHEVVQPEQEMAAVLADRMVTPHLQTKLSLDRRHRIVELEASAELWGKSLQELDFRARFKLNVIAIRKRRLRVGVGGESVVDNEINDLPAGSDLIDKGDILVVLGADEAILRFAEGEERV